MGLIKSKAREMKKEAERSKLIDRMMKSERRRENQIAKVLPIGDKDSGRTTFMKQMKVSKISL